MSDFKFPSETIELPSKGLLYPEDNPLSSGKIEIKYMTAREEDILTNQAYIEKGTVLDKLIESLIVDKNINYKDLIIGDKNAVLVTARVLGYGKNYTFNLRGEEHTVDLTEVDNREIDESKYTKGQYEIDRAEAMNERADEIELPDYDASPDDFAKGGLATMFRKK